MNSHVASLSALAVGLADLDSRHAAAVYALRDKISADPEDEPEAPPLLPVPDRGATEEEWNAYYDQENRAHRMYGRPTFNVTKEEIVEPEGAPPPPKDVELEGKELAKKLLDEYTKNLPKAPSKSRWDASLDVLAQELHGLGVSQYAASVCALRDEVFDHTVQARWEEGLDEAAGALHRLGSLSFAEDLCGIRDLVAAPTKKRSPARKKKAPVEPVEEAEALPSVETLPPGELPPGYHLVMRDETGAPIAIYPSSPSVLKQLKSEHKSKQDAADLRRSLGKGKGGPSEEELDAEMRRAVELAEKEESARAEKVMLKDKRDQALREKDDADLAENMALRQKERSNQELLLQKKQEEEDARLNVKKKGFIEFNAFLDDVALRLGRLGSSQVGACCELRDELTPQAQEADIQFRAVQGGAIIEKIISRRAGMPSDWAEGVFVTTEEVAGLTH